MEFMQCVLLIVTVATILLCLPDKYFPHAENTFLPSNIVKSLNLAPAILDMATRWQPAIAETPTFSFARSFPLWALKMALIYIHRQTHPLPQKLLAGAELMCQVGVAASSA